MSAPNLPEDVRAFLDAVPNPRRRTDAIEAVKLVSDLSELEPRMWGSIVGFGERHYRYATGREGDTMIVGVAPRAAALTFYGLVSYDDEPLLEQLGPHYRGKGCLYLKDLAAVDRDVLGRLILEALQHDGKPSDWRRSGANQGPATTPVSKQDRSPV